MFKTGIMSPTEAWKHKLRHIPTNGFIALEPGETAVMGADGNPIIVSVAGPNMLVAHTDEPNVVDSIVEAFRERGDTSPLDIMMCIQMYLPRKDDAFVEKAARAGLRYVWSQSPVAEFLAQAKAPIGRPLFITIQRD